MARCNSCSAPLKANSNRCEYCGVRSDVDLHSKYDYSISEHQSHRICPSCDIKLNTIELAIDNKTNESLNVERCDKCFGIFFDPGELETLVENSVSNVFTINQEQLKNINKDRYKKEKKISYKKCPECQQFMQRKNYSHRSGVVIDRCNQHGIWLDSGEISHILEWYKAGGQILHEKVESSKAAQASSSPSPSFMGDKLELDRNRRNNSQVDLLGGDLIDNIGHLLAKLF